MILSSGIGQIHHIESNSFLYDLFCMGSPHPVVNIEDLDALLGKYIVHLPRVVLLWPLTKHESTVPKFPVRPAQVFLQGSGWKTMCDS